MGFHLSHFHMKALVYISCRGQRFSLAVHSSFHSTQSKHLFFTERSSLTHYKKMLQGLRIDMKDALKKTSIHQSYKIQNMFLAVFNYFMKIYVISTADNRSVVTTESCDLTMFFGLLKVYVQ